jgi:hypothetical protein
MEQATTIDLTKARAQTRAMAATINHEVAPCPTFTMASQNVATVATLFDMLSAPSTDGVDRVHHQLTDILRAATEQQEKSSLQ